MNCLIGIDLGGTNIAAGVVTQEGRLLSKCSLPTGAGRPADEIVRDMARAVQLSLEQAGVERECVSALGVGVPGAVDARRGMVLRTTNLDWRLLPLGDQLQMLTGFPVYLGNDADCAALGEVYAGAARDYDSAVMITLGTGVGGGIVAHNRVFEGWNGGGTEAGHIPLILGGEPCGCGNRGCFEAYASATALIRQTKTAMQAHPDSALWQLCPEPDRVNAKTPFDAALLGDETARAVLDRYEEYLAAGIGGIVNLLRPQAVILGGGVSNQGEFLLAPVREKLRKYCYASEFIAPPVLLRAALGNDAGIIGAALLGLDAEGVSKRGS